ncbi:MAG: hypothetical protein QGD89_07855 [Actinomycetota bacterium]|nr:hypothetical protein [Actinomycetota bacterium]
MAPPSGDEADRANVRADLRLIHALPLVPLFLVALLAARPIRDNSFLWHIRAGSIQVADSRVITNDPFSFTMVGEPWRTQSWLLEILYAQFESSFATLAWANLLVFVVGGLTVALIGCAVYRATSSPVTTSVAILLTVWLAGPFLQPRPVIVSYLLLAALVVVLQNRDRVIWLVVPIIWIWAAVHGSWVIGGGLIILEWLRTSDRRVFQAGVAALGASLLTAHGVGIWQILGEFAGARDALALMQEWKVPDFGGIVQAPYLLLVVGIIVAAMRGRLTGRDLIVILPFLFFGMTSRRTVFPAAIVVLPWAALALPALRIPRSATPRAVAALVVAAVAALVVSPLILQPLGVLDRERFPSEEIREAIEGRNVFHDDGVGGYLIYKEWPDRLVYIDDRAELYGAERIAEYIDANQGRYREVFERYGFDAALSRRAWPLTDILDADGWERVAEDEIFVVFHAPGS